jgi:hypothetical protein
LWSIDEVLVGTVAHACHPSYSGSKDWEDHGLRLSLAKCSQDHILTNKKMSTGVCACHPSSAGDVSRRVVVQAGLDIKKKTKILFKK